MEKVSYHVLIEGGNQKNTNAGWLIFYLVIVHEKIDELLEGLCFTANIMRIRQRGLFFSYVLTERTLQLRLFLFFPIAGFRLSRLENMRRASIREFYEITPRRFFMPWKYWAWPVSLGYIGKREISRYVLRTRSGTRIWLRLKPEIHYHLRRLTNEAQLDDSPPVSSRPSAWAKPAR